MAPPAGESGHAVRSRQSCIKQCILMVMVPTGSPSSYELTFTDLTTDGGEATDIKVVAIALGQVSDQVPLLSHASSR